VISRAFLFLLHNLIINIKKYFFPGALTFEVRIAVWRRMPSHIYIYICIYIYIYIAQNASSQVGPVPSMVMIMVR
jgi:hypothetical protein